MFLSQIHLDLGVLIGKVLGNEGKSWLFSIFSNAINHKITKVTCYSGNLPSVIILYIRVIVKTLMSILKSYM